MRNEVTFRYHRVHGLHFLGYFCGDYNANYEHIDNTIFAGSVAKHLFNTIAVMDFLTNACYSPIVLRYMLDPYLHPVMRVGTNMEASITIYFNLIVASSIVASTALAICRYIRIKFPFYAIKKMTVCICCVITVTTQLGFIMSYSFIKKDVKVFWYRYSVQAFNISFEAMIAGKYLLITRLIVSSVTVCIGIIVSVLSVLELRKSSKVTYSSRVNITKSSRVIVCMNIYNAICVVGLMVTVAKVYRYPGIFFLGRTGLPITGAAFNATVRLMASKDIYKYCKSLIFSEH